VEVGAQLALIADASEAAGGDGSAPAAAASSSSAAPAAAAAADDEEEPVDDNDDPDLAATPAPAAAPRPSGPGGGATPVTMPALGESVTEGTVTRWLKQVGDTVEVDEPLLEVSTDKVDTEIPAP